jgi:hypothetical protein
MKKVLITLGIASLLSIPMALALNWAVQTIDSYTFTCPSTATFCTLYPLGQGNGFPSYTLSAGQSVTSVLTSRMIVYPVVSTCTTTSSSSTTTSESSSTTTTTMQD